MYTLERFFKTFVVSLVSVVFLFIVFRYLFIGVNYRSDWFGVFYPALTASDPFSVVGYFNPPWLIWMLSPLSTISVADAYALWVSIVFLLAIRCIYSMGGNWLSIIIVATSIGFVMSIFNGQVDILVLLGLMIGSWGLVLIKPQVLGLVVLYDIIREKRIDWSLIPLVIISIIASGFWVTNILTMEGLYMGANISIFPYGIPIGICLFLLSLLRRDVYLAGLSTFFFVPYVSENSLLVYIAIIASRYGSVAGIVVNISTWIVWLI